MTEPEHNIWVWRGYDRDTCKPVDCLLEGTDSAHAITEFHAEGYASVFTVTPVSGRYDPDYDDIWS